MFYLWSAKNGSNRRKFAAVVYIRSIQKRPTIKEINLLRSESILFYKMKIGIIISQTHPETVWNALRFANKIFLLGAGVEIESIKSDKFHVQEQLGKLNELGGKC